MGESKNRILFIDLFMAKIILHADDFGFDKDSCEATIECFEKGALTSASIMPTCSATDMAIHYASQHNEFSFGTHLTFVDGLVPVIKERENSLLVNGFFAPSNVVRMRAMLFRLNIKDIVNEMKAQIKILKNEGIAVSHLDSHGHLHKFPSFLLALKQIKKERPEIRIRRSQTIFIHPHQLGPRSLLNLVFDKYISYYFNTTDQFYMPANSMDTNWAEQLMNIVDKLPDSATVEIGVHPGHVEKWRQQEYDDILTFATYIRDSNHKLISWKDI